MNVLVGVALFVVAVLVLRVLMRRDERYAPGLPAATNAAPGDTREIEALLARGRKIEAIKAYRRLHRTDLKAAKEAVERIAARLPDPS